MVMLIREANIYARVRVRCCGAKLLARRYFFTHTQRPLLVGGMRSCTAAFICFWFLLFSPRKIFSCIAVSHGYL